jgi:hypothetical protein
MARDLKRERLRFRLESITRIAGEFWFQRRRGRLPRVGSEALFPPEAGLDAALTPETRPDYTSPKFWLRDGNPYIGGRSPRATTAAARPFRNSRCDCEKSLLIEKLETINVIDDMLL